MTDQEKEAKILFKLVKKTYGQHIREQDLPEVEKMIVRIVETSQKLREVKLENSTEPFSVFKPYREDDE